MNVWEFIRVRILRRDPYRWTDENGRDYILFDGIHRTYIDDLMKKLFEK